jgi:hypothetical protein
MSAPWLADLKEKGLILDDSDTFTATVALNPSANNQLVGSWQLRPYMIPRLAYFGQAWDSVGGLITYDLRVNGGNLFQYSRLQSAIAAPYSDTSYLPVPVVVPQLSTLAVYADGGAFAGGVVCNFTTRLTVFYFRQDPNLQKLLWKPGRSHLENGFMGNFGRHG